MTGTITKYALKKKRGRFSWGYVIDTGKEQNGRRHQLSRQGFETKAKAEEALQEKIAELKKRPGVCDPRSFSDVFDAWIREHCQRHCEATTTEGYLAKGAYSKRYLADLPITKITPLQIQNVLNDLRDHGGKKTTEAPKGRPLSPKTIREIAAVINMTFNAAIRWGIVDMNPMVRVTLPRAEKREPKILEKLQLEWFLSGVEGHPWMHLLLLLDAATGCRRGELLALAWRDIDFYLGNLSISKSLAQTKAKGVFLKLPKGRKVRRFSLAPSTLEALKMHREKQTEIRKLVGADYHEDLDLVFATPEGDYLKPDSVTAKISLVARKLGFPKGISLHTLRHTHGSHLLSQGVPLPAVSKRLGHANTHITATVYSHALERDDQLASEAWEKTMGDLVRIPAPKRM